jgi:tetratricopeptide (TPR) repeat protein
MRHSSQFVPIVFSIFVAAAGWAQQEDDCSLFVTTAPIAAQVVVDSTPVGASPVLVTSLRAGAHVVSIQKPGYVTLEEELELADGEVGVFRRTLTANEFVATFSANQTVVNEQSYDRTDSRFVLPSGGYLLSSEEEGLRVESVYPLESAFTALLYVTPALALVSIGATLEDVWLRDKETSLPTPATFASWAATTASGGMLLALALDRRRYREETTIREYASLLTAAEAEELFQTGEAALRAGNLASAIAAYSRVVAAGADSEYVPGALYKSAHIYLASGEEGEEMAMRAFQLLVSTYPDPDYYDGAQKAIADLYYGNQEYDLALAALEQILFVGEELFTREEIAQYAAEIRAHPAESAEEE